MLNSSIMKKSFLFIFVVLLLNFSCKKDRTYNRILGRHILTEYTANGIDSLQSFKDSLGTEFYFYYDDLNDKYVTQIIGNSDISYIKTVIWYWSLNNNYKNLTVYDTYSNSIGVGPFGKNKIPNWEILKLKTKDIKLKTNYNSKEYIIELTTQ